MIQPHLIEPARLYLRSFDKAAQQRGAALQLAGAVLGIETQGSEAEATVLGTQVYFLSLNFDAKRWRGVCSCPVGADCKHCYAAMSAILKEADEGGVRPLVKEKGKAKKATGAQKQEPLTPQESFVPRVMEFAGRELTDIEADAAKAVDELFYTYSTYFSVPRSLVNRLFGVKSATNTWDNVELWPQHRPQTLDEAWMLIAAYSRQVRRTLAPLLADMIEWDKVDAFVGEFERRDRVDEWQEKLRQLQLATPAAQPVSHEIALRLMPVEARLEWRRNGVGEFKAMNNQSFQQLVSANYSGTPVLTGPSLVLWRAFFTGYGSRPALRYDEPDCARILNVVLREDSLLPRVLGPAGEPLVRDPRALEWRVVVAGEERADYHFALTLPDGTAAPAALVVVEGLPALYVTKTAIFNGPPSAGLPLDEPVVIPSEAMETADGVALFERLTLAPPARLASRVRVAKVKAVLRCVLEKNQWGDGETLMVGAFAEVDGKKTEVFGRDGWSELAEDPKKRSAKAKEEATIVSLDRSALAGIPAALEELKVTWQGYRDLGWQKTAGKKFAEQFSEWLGTLPANITLELDPLLASLRDPEVAARVKVDVAESGIDWFDIKIALDVPDTTLTQKELKALLDARGGFVRLGEKGWRRIKFELSPEDEEQFAELGLNPRDFTAAPQRLHALQLAGSAKKLLPEPAARAVLARAELIRTSVTPPVPPALKASLRDYQRDGYHFLAYLTENRFGGILADDMGLGKTVQTLAWLLWLRERDGVEKSPYPALVVAPKSVVENWRSEAAKFAPDLRVRTLEKGKCDASSLEHARKDADIVVMNYVHLRLLERAIPQTPWCVAILDEAQAVKNPDSATARAAWSINAPYRLALSGTPIENRLLDLWSIMGFAMPGVLGTRAAFGKTYDQRSDAFARKRLGARTRPFILRRTKGEVAKDLPDRVEEDIICEMEGEQLTLYRAELKRARAELLKIQTKAQLDKSRFNILTSLLRLRQICCHPGLVSEKATDAESAKVSALMDLVEPLMAEGHKVLIFSQFVEMLDRIEAEMTTRFAESARLFKLTGQTEERGELVREFQGHEGSAAFLISLRAGGFGLNLTAASYVVLFDPWWNPAVENQAIDRTHRIGQVNKVIAYRLVMKESIEEKIRTLQKQKRELAADILGEENFARALTISDFEFLFGSEQEPGV